MSTVRFHPANPQNYPPLPIIVHGENEQRVNNDSSASSIEFLSRKANLGDYALVAPKPQEEKSVATKASDFVLKSATMPFTIGTTAGAQLGNVVSRIGGLLSPKWNEKNEHTKKIAASAAELHRQLDGLFQELRYLNFEQFLSKKETILNLFSKIDTVNLIEKNLVSKIEQGLFEKGFEFLRRGDGEIVSRNGIEATLSELATLSLVLFHRKAQTAPNLLETIDDLEGRFTFGGTITRELALISYSFKTNKEHLFPSFYTFNKTEISRLLTSHNQPSAIVRNNLSSAGGNTLQSLSVLSSQMAMIAQTGTRGVRPILEAVPALQLGGLSLQLIALLRPVFMSSVPTNVQSYRTLFDSLRRDNRERVALQPENIRNLIAKIDTDIEAALSSWKGTSEDCPSDIIIRRFSLLQEFPSNARWVGPSNVAGLDPHEQQRARSMERRLNCLYKDFSHIDKIQSVIESLIVHMDTHNPTSKKQLLAFGPPGCGKNFFVKSLSEALNLPLLTVSLNSVDDMVKFFGVSYYESSSLANARMTDDQLLGQLPKFMIDHGASNVIVHFNESGEAFKPKQKKSTEAAIATLKRVLDGDFIKQDTRCTELPAINLSKVVFIVSGNYFPENDDSVLQRFITLQFKPLPPEAKKRALAKKFKEKANYEQQASLSPSQASTVHSEASKFFEILLKFDRLAENEGIRPLFKAVDMIFSYIATRTINGEQVKEGEIPKMIEDLLPPSKNNAIPPVQPSDVTESSTQWTNLFLRHMPYLG